MVICFTDRSHLLARSEGVGGGEGRGERGGEGAVRLCATFIVISVEQTTARGAGESYLHP